LLSVTKHSATPLRRFLKKTGIRQSEFSRAIGRTRGYLSQLVNGITGASEKTQADMLLFAAKKLGRAVAHEEMFGSPAARRRALLAATQPEGKR
jgi:transcriptional regulator with XRE-family HTH domain